MIAPICSFVPRSSSSHRARWRGRPVTTELAPPTIVEFIALTLQPVVNTSSSRISTTIYWSDSQTTKFDIRVIWGRGSRDALRCTLLLPYMVITCVKVVLWSIMLICNWILKASPLHLYLLLISAVAIVRTCTFWANYVICTIPDNTTDDILTDHTHRPSVVREW